MIVTKTKGVSELLAKLNQLSAPPKINIKAAPDGYGTYGYHNETRALPMIANAQKAKYGRDPFFTTPTETRRGIKMLGAVFMAWTGDRMSEMVSICQQTGSYLSGVAQRHIIEGRSRGNKPMRPLTPRYEQIKKWVLHAEGKPILIATGQLWKSIKGNVTIRNLRRRNG